MGKKLGECECMIQVIDSLYVAINHWSCRTPDSKLVSVIHEVLAVDDNANLWIGSSTFQTVDEYVETRRIPDNMEYEISGVFSKQSLLNSMALDIRKLSDFQDLEIPIWVSDVEEIQSQLKYKDDLMVRIYPLDLVEEALELAIQRRDLTVEGLNSL